MSQRWVLGTIQVSTDSFDTSLIVYQLIRAVRKELAMYATTPRQEKHAATKKKASPQLNKRELTMHEREQFMQAKMKELRSFFENGIAVEGGWKLQVPLYVSVLVFNFAMVWIDSRRCDSILTRTSSNYPEKFPTSWVLMNDPNAAAQNSIKEIDIKWAAPSSVWDPNGAWFAFTWMT